MGWGQPHAPAATTPGKTRYPFYRRLGGPQGRSGRAENLVHHRESIQDRPTRSQSLYRLSYPDRRWVLYSTTFLIEARVAVLQKLYGNLQDVALHQ